MMRHLYCALFLLISALPVWGIDLDVIDGVEVAPGSRLAQFTVLLQLKDPQGRVRGSCTGVIVARDLILSAGHCFTTPGMSVDVKFGVGGIHGYTHTINSK